MLKRLLYTRNHQHAQAATKVRLVSCSTNYGIEKVHFDQSHHQNLKWSVPAYQLDVLSVKQNPDLLIVNILRTEIRLLLYMYTLLQSAVWWSA